MQIAGLIPDDEEAKMELMTAIKIVVVENRIKVLAQQMRRKNENNNKKKNK